MPSRDWRNWPNRLRDEANSEAGLVALATALATAGSVYFAAALVAAVGASVTVVAVGVCTYRSIPPKRPHPSELMGRVIKDLSTLESVNPPLRKISFIGASRVGKSTLLKTLQAQVPDGLVTDDPYAVVVLLQTQPVTYFALIDAAGQEYAQQFRVYNAADKAIIMLDHAEVEEVVKPSKGRLDVHTQFLNQLLSNIKLSKRDVADVRFLLNKKDLWERSIDKDVVLAWFDSTVAAWKSGVDANVTSSIHSNRSVPDVNSLIRFLSSWSSS